MPFDPPFAVPEVPGIYVSITNSLVTGEPDEPSQAVVVGTRLSTGSVAELVPKQLRSGAEADLYWGQGSMISEMVKALLAQTENAVDVWGVALDEEAGGVASAGNFGVAGAATASGTLELWVAGRRVRVAVAKGQDAATVIDNAVIEVNDVPTLPVAATDGTTTLNLTCKWKGESGDDIDLRLDPDGTVPAGLTVTVTAMAGGATDPEIDAALTALGDEKYGTVVCGYRDTTNIGHLDAWLETRWGPTVQKEGQGFVAHVGSFGDLTTLAAGLNSKFITVVAPSSSPTPPWIIAAATGGADALVTKQQPNRPRNGIVLKPYRSATKSVPIRPAAQQDRFTLEQRSSLLANGISTATGTPSGALQLERLLTTATLDNGGFADNSYKELAVMRTLGRLRYDLQVWRYRYKDWVVSSDETQKNFQKVMTPGRLRQELTGLYKTWLDNTLCQDAEFFKSNLIVEVAENKMDFNIFVPVKLVYPLNAMAAELAFI